MVFVALRCPAQGTEQRGTRSFIRALTSCLQPLTVLDDIGYVVLVVRRQLFHTILNRHTPGSIEGAGPVGEGADVDNLAAIDREDLVELLGWRDRAPSARRNTLSPSTTASPAASTLFTVATVPSAWKLRYQSRAWALVWQSDQCTSG